MTRPAKCPTQSFLARPELRGAGHEENRHIHVHDDGAQRPHFGDENGPRGKRGAANHEPVAGSPRAVRARHQEQGKRDAPWAIARRCAFVERRNPAAMQMQYGRNRQDSWDETAIEPGVFPSVGSAIEPAHGNWPRGGYVHGSEVDENMMAPRDRYQDAGTQHMQLGGAPIPTPVRNQRTMGVQTNRESISRHHRANGGSDASDDEEEETLVAGRRPFGDASAMMNSERSVMTGKTDNMSVLNSGRTVLKELRYPTNEQIQISAMSRDLLQKARATAFDSPSQGQMALGLALSLAVKDEFDRLDGYWGLTEGGSKPEEKIAQSLKKIVTRVEKKCTLKSLAPSVAQAYPEMSLAPATNPEERCAQLEAEIAAADRRIAGYKEALQRPSPPQEADSHKVLADLSDRLSAMHCDPDGVAVPGMAEFEDKVDQCIQGVVVANACYRQLFSQCQDEHKTLQEQNRDFCPQASGSQESSQVPIADGGARSILRAIQ